LGRANAPRIWVRRFKMRFLRWTDADPMRDQPARGDQEDSGLPRIAIQAPANLPRSTGRPHPFLICMPILQWPQADWKRKCVQIFGVFLSICSKIACEIPKEFRRVGIRANYQKSIAARYGKRLNIRPLISPIGSHTATYGQLLPIRIAR
jgi:hypothetical protein